MPHSLSICPTGSLALSMAHCQCLTGSLNVSMSHSMSHPLVALHGVGVSISSGRAGWWKGLDIWRRDCVQSGAATVTIVPTDSSWMLTNCISLCTDRMFQYSDLCVDHFHPCGLTTFALCIDHFYPCVLNIGSSILTDSRCLYIDHLYIDQFLPLYIPYVPLY